jgi:hypothetical protein
MGRAMPQRRAEIRIVSWPRADRASSERPLDWSSIMHARCEPVCRILVVRLAFQDGEDVSRLAETDSSGTSQRPSSTPSLQDAHSTACYSGWRLDVCASRDHTRRSELRQQRQPRADDTQDRDAQFPHAAADHPPLLRLSPAADKRVWPPLWCLSCRPPPDGPPLLSHTLGSPCRRSKLSWRCTVQRTVPVDNPESGADQNACFLDA